jgi:fused signal recognition particle receptor
MSEEKSGWFGRLKAGLSKSSAKLTDGISRVFTESTESVARVINDTTTGISKAVTETTSGIGRAVTDSTSGIVKVFRRRRLDQAALDELEEALIQADLGPAPAAKLVASLRRTKFDKEVTDEEVRTALAEDVAEILRPVAKPLAGPAGVKPHVVLVVGVNGTGKTTTIGKLAQAARAEGKKVVMAAGDTFRAAAVEQLKIWGERTGATVVARSAGGDAAGLAFDALVQAKAEGADLLLIDTAGRLHNKTGLMQELQKIRRVLQKQDPAVPHDTILVLDATTGQNAVQQVKVFKEMVTITGLVVTKLDGTAKGGVLVALADTFGVAIHAVGVGEGADDLRPFDPTDFARGLLGLER